MLRTLTSNIVCSAVIAASHSPYLAFKNGTGEAPFSVLRGSPPVAHAGSFTTADEKQLYCLTDRVTKEGRKILVPEACQRYDLGMLRHHRLSLSWRKHAEEMLHTYRKYNATFHASGLTSPDDQCSVSSAKQSGVLAVQVSSIQEVAHVECQNGSNNGHQSSTSFSGESGGVLETALGM